MVQINLWTSIDGFRSLKSNKFFYAYSEKNEKNCLHVSVPVEAISFHEKSEIPDEGISFLCRERSSY